VKLINGTLMGISIYFGFYKESGLMEVMVTLDIA